MNDLKNYTMFLSAWGWQILSMMFLSFSFVFLAIPRTLMTQSFFVSFFLVFIICEFMSIKRRREFYEDA